MFIIDLAESLSVGASKAGNKAYNLALLEHALDLNNIPRSIVLLVHEEKDDTIAIAEAIERVERNFTYPVIARSSTNVEDSAYSFAGLFVSDICHSEDDLATTIRNVLDSPMSDAVVQYCAFKRIDPTIIKTAVLIQEYIPPQMAGVLFTKHPVSNDRDVFYLEYKEKSSDAVTSGSHTPTGLIISKNDIDEAPLQFKQLLSIATKAEEFFGYPLDVEWIISKDELWIVQVRQVTA